MRVSKNIILSLLLLLVIITGCTSELPTQPAPPVPVYKPTVQDTDPTPNECNIDSDCEQGICEDGSTYKKYSCSNNECITLNYVRDPCDKVEINYYIGDKVRIRDEDLIIKQISQRSELIFCTVYQDFSVIFMY